MPLDKHPWTTPKQAQWLKEWFPSYLEVQSHGQYDTFWPGFFRDWFETFPAPEPRWDKPTDSEHKSDSDSEQTDGEVYSATLK